jgi:hypothetical protein
MRAGPWLAGSRWRCASRHGRGRLSGHGLFRSEKPSYQKQTRPADPARGELVPAHGCRPSSCATRYGINAAICGKWTPHTSGIFPAVIRGVLSHPVDMARVPSVRKSGQKKPRRFRALGRVHRSSPRRELRGADPGLRSAPKDKGPARGRPLLCLSGYSGVGAGLSATARIAAIGRAQAPPSPPAGGPERTTIGLSFCQGCASCASVLAYVLPIA